MKRTAGKSLRTRKAMEQAIHLIFLLCGIVAVGFVLCISVYLVISGLPAIREISDVTYDGDTIQCTVLLETEAGETQEVIEIEP